MDTLISVVPFFNSNKVNCSAISRTTKINIRTVQRYYLKYKKQLPLSLIRLPGRPPKFKEKINQAITQIVKAEKEISSMKIIKDIKKNYKINISPSTICRRLKKMGFKKIKPKFIPMITNKQKEKRL